MRTRRLKYEVGAALRRWLERYIAEPHPWRREAEREVARRLLATPAGERPEVFPGVADLIHEYELDRSLELAELPVSLRRGKAKGRLSVRFMRCLERALGPGGVPRERRMELRLMAGWGHASDDQVWLLHRDGKCRAALMPQVRALARLLGFEGDPFDLTGEDEL
jgi:hypothetical protein